MIFVYIGYAVLAVLGFTTVGLALYTAAFFIYHFILPRQEVKVKPRSVKYVKYNYERK